MKAIIKQGHEKGAVAIDDVDEPDYARDEIRLRVSAAGVCGSDVGAYLAKPEYEYMSVPGILGHECAGIVESIGSDVEHVSPGDRVVLQPGNPCGGCYQCRTGEPNNCPDRAPAVAAGGFAPSLVTTPDQVIPVPDDVPIEHAAITEPLAVTHRAVDMKGNVSPGDSVLVQGPGPMGAFSALIADSAGGDVVVTGLPTDESRLEALAALGVETVTVDPDTGDPSPSSLAERYTSRRGFDVTIDATGAGAGVTSAIEATRDGGTVVVVGIPSGEVPIEMPDLIRAEIDLQTSHGSVAENYYQALELLRSPDPLPVESIIDTVDPRAPTEAFDAFVRAETIKPIFEIDRLELTT